MHPNIEMTAAALTNSNRRFGSGAGEREGVIVLMSVTQHSHLSDYYACAFVNASGRA
jgi:hypothetical protein